MKSPLWLRALASSAALVLNTLASVPAHAQVDTLKLVVPFPAGGALDFTGRLLADRLRTPALAAVVENRAGANGNVGSQAVAQSNDGKTLLVASDGVITVNHALYKNPPGFDPVRDLEPLAMLAYLPSVLVVPADSPHRTVADLVAEARKREMTYASGGIGSAGHLTMGYLASVADLKMRHIPYNGGAPAMVALVGGQTESAFVVLPGAIGQVKSGKLRALAVSTGRRVPALPDVPTMIESGFAGFELTTAFLLMAPAKAPTELKTTMAARAIEVAAQTDFQSRLESQGLIPVPRMGPKETGDWLQRERLRWTTFIQKHGITASN